MHDSPPPCDITISEQLLTGLFTVCYIVSQNNYCFCIQWMVVNQINPNPHGHGHYIFTVHYSKSELTNLPLHYLLCKSQLTLITKYYRHYNI